MKYYQDKFNDDRIMCWSVQRGLGHTLANKCVNSTEIIFESKLFTPLYTSLHLNGLVAFE